MTIHILTQYLWPDSAPTAIYAEQLGLCLSENRFNVRLVSGSGSYRVGSRQAPPLEHRKLPTCNGQRGKMLSTLREYHSVCLAFKRYIGAEVNDGDVVVCISAPPQTIHLVQAIKRKKAKAIYWLQDYYPELLRGYLNYPQVIRQVLSKYWTSQLSGWHHVVKIGANLSYEDANARILRNWPSLDLGQPRPFEPKTAFYFGNLGYGHCHRTFIETCAELRDQGYSITLVGDGPKVAKLPSWIKITPSPDEATLVDLHWRAEIHLIAADPKITGAIFPSKYWNSRQTGRKIIASGFAGPMLEELNSSNALTQLPRPEDWLPLFAT